MRLLTGLFLASAIGVIFIVGYYYLNALGKPPTAMSTKELEAFGSYFGGVAAPLLAFLTIAGLVIALLMQNRQIEQVSEASIATQHVRMLDELHEDMKSIENQNINSTQTFQSILNGSAKLHRTEEDTFQTLLNQYVKALGIYATGVAMYRDNVSPYWDCKAFENRGLRLLERIRPHQKYLGQMGGPTLAIIERHLKS